MTVEPGTECQTALPWAALRSYGLAKALERGEEALMMSPPEREARSFVARHIASEYARDRVTKALYEAVVDGLAFGPRDLALPEDRDWIRGHVAIPLQEATDAALEVLTWSLCRALEKAPNELLDRLERSHHLEHLGFE